MTITANQIAAFRKKAGLSREAFAQRLGLPFTPAKVWAVETGKREPRSDELAALERLLSATSETHTLPDVPKPLKPTPRPVEESAVDPPTRVAETPPTELLETQPEDVPPWAVPDGARRFSNSEVQTFKDCRRKWWLGWYRKLTLLHEAPTQKKHSGDRVHRALMAWYVPEGETPTDPRESLERAIVEDWTLLHSGEFPPTEAQVNKFKAFNGLERAMIEGYVEHIKTTGLDVGLRVIAPETYLEAPLEVPYVERDTRVIGKIDVRTERELDNVRMFIDHKTVDGIDSHVIMLPLNEQMLHYHLLEWLNTAEGEARCDGALYNMLRRVKRTARAVPPFYERVEVRHNIHELHNFRDRLTATLGDIFTVEQALDQGISHHQVAYPRPSNDCTWKCEFFSICPMFNDGSRIEDLISQYYTVADPLSYYKTAVVETKEVSK